MLQRQENNAAEGAALRAHRAGKNSGEILDVLEQAEHHYQTLHPLEAYESHHHAESQEAKATTGHRQRVVEALFKALSSNVHFNSKTTDDLWRDAQTSEKALYDRSHSATVYLSSTANAARVGGDSSIAAVDDLVRISLGQPKGTSNDEPSPYISGLQGFVIKPDYGI